VDPSLEALTERAWIIGLRMAATADELAWLAGQPAFSVDGAPYSWGDVLLSAELRGTLEELTQATRRGLGAEGRLSGAEELRAAAARFRYERNLLSAEELEAWLARWHLELDDWTGHLRRTLLPHERTEPLSPADDDGLEKAVAVDAICTGFLEREARKLAADAVLAAGAVASGDRGALIAQVTSSAAAARTALAAAADVEREVANRALEWTRIEADLLHLGDVDTAREAALSVRLDGRPLADVARDCGAPLERRTLYVEEAEQERLTELLGARPGELVGPVARGDGFLLVHVNARTRPNADDPELRRRAKSYLVERAVERELEARVRWA